MKTNEKAATVATVHGSENTFLAASSKSDFHFENRINIEKLQSDLLEHLKQNQKIIKLCRCFGCNNGYAPRKMSSIPGVCRKCMKESQTKGKTAQSNFIARTVNNFQKLLRRGVQV